MSDEPKITIASAQASGFSEEQKTTGADGTAEFQTPVGEYEIEGTYPSDTTEPRVETAEVTTSSEPTVVALGEVAQADIDALRTRLEESMTDDGGGGGGSSGPIDGEADSPYGTGPDGSWELTFEDMFSAGSLDTNNWSIGFGWGRTHGGPPIETVRDEDVWVDSDNNELVIRTTDDGGWYSGAVNTRHKHAQQHGYWEAAIKIPPSDMGTAGMIPAYWAKPNDEGWPPELDIFEFMNRRTHPEYHIHYGENDSEWGTSYDAGQDLSQDFHVYGAHWAPDFTAFYFNGEEVARTSEGHGTGQYEMNNGQPFYFMINTHLWPADWLGGHPDQNQYPQQMRVKWARVWSDVSTSSAATQTLSHEEAALRVR